MLSILQRKFGGIATRAIETEDKPISVIPITQFCDSSIEVGLTILLTQTTTGVHLEAFGFAGGGWFSCTEDWGRNTWVVKEIAPHLEEEGFKLD